MRNCSLLEYFHLHSNEIGDEGCIALGREFSTGGCAWLFRLNLSANGIDDKGCAALSALFSGTILANLDLSENYTRTVALCFLFQVKWRARKLSHLRRCNSST